MLDARFSPVEILTHSCNFYESTTISQIDNVPINEN